MGKKTSGRVTRSRKLEKGEGSETAVELVVKGWAVKGKRGTMPVTNVSNNPISGVEGVQIGEANDVNGVDMPIDNVPDAEDISSTETVGVYGSPKGIFKILENLSAAQKRDIEAIGFGGLLQIKLDEYFQGMVPFLVNSYNNAARRFSIDEDRACSVTALDVRDVFMLPCGTGKLVNEASRKKRDNPDVAVVQKWKDMFEILPKKELAATKLCTRMMALQEGGDDFIRFFVLYAMGTLLAPTPHKNIDFQLVTAVENVGEIGKLDWCEYVLFKLDEGVEMYRTHRYKKISGCVLLLQIMYAHRLIWRGLKAPSDLPLVQHWTSSALKRRVLEEKREAARVDGKYGLGEWDTSTYPVSKQEGGKALKNYVAIGSISHDLGDICEINKHWK